jgi:hypothetical protein
VKSNLEQARAQAELFYDANSNAYFSGSVGGTTDVCSPTGSATGGIKGIYPSVLAAAQAVGGNVTVTEGGAASATVAPCNAGASAWAAEVPLKAATGYFCVDSTGVATSTPTAVATGVTHC